LFSPTRTRGIVPDLPPKQVRSRFDLPGFSRIMGGMWFNEPCEQPSWAKAARHLSRVDPVLGAVIRRVGPCTLAPRRDYFVVLCKSIYNQQISTKVAAVLFARFRQQFPRQRPTPQAVLAFLSGDPEKVRAVGLSRQKALYLRDLATHFIDGRIPTRKLCRLDDQAVIDALVGVNGIGRWTAEMFLMFVLNRPDVLPVDDLGLREGVRDIFGLPARPTPSQVIEMGEKWRPYRSVATWYVWRRHVNATEKPAGSPTSGIAPSASASTRRRSAAARRRK
jgi:DNA-3-methyladenine glycosylase II